MTNIFAASAVSCYYWYRIPNLFGFGQFEKDGLLIDLKNIIPDWSITVVIVALSLFFFYWLVIRTTNKKSWVVRPSYS
ncbi:MAG: hypothetical protein IPO04_21245 [Cytophagaceae bacterium]|nr:hypothetical protein [Cytophagaceae bacterium]